MTSSEYRNTIQWTLATQTPADEDIVATARRIFKNLGIAFPQGTLGEAIKVLDYRNYMGWNACSAEQAGYPSFVKGLKILLSQDSNYSI